MKHDGIKKEKFGSVIIRYDVLDSTNTKAKELAVNGALEGTVVVADQQRSGRGRLGRIWQSPAGKGLWFTLILRPSISPEFGAQVTLLAAVAVVDALERVIGISAKIKWPNDIIVGKKKLCGILSELVLSEEEIDYVIVGIGLNVNFGYDDFSRDLAECASSVFLQTGTNWDCDVILHAILESFERRYFDWQENGFGAIRTEWKSKNCTLENIVSVRDNDQEIFHGKAINIDDYGCLLVCNENGITRKFDFGEISIR